MKKQAHDAAVSNDEGDVDDEGPEPIDTLQKDEEWKQYRRDLVVNMCFYWRLRVAGLDQHAAVHN